ncbi:IS110 family transposase [Pseudobacteroides cellulosolvens]|uniref:Transposase IS111A/IS1328/IS1533 n=1 Tax=Pseudobacteroides cellulosolvens ATCC 35603 = DSM 2933 TaxID=398512 RepID=A0A0L6JK11_9FIRM|nr:IS110 family transposase [Pseudobacteroides cellulosolvens]KNY26100.1 transposase IS111A/IS1328/IS1533 [Pseudobacteroides cellulosolvens ATCC 35603 = DSM 2933]
MLKLYEKVCGLDVHKASITACIITPEGKEIKTYGTMTADIIEMIEEIKNKGCTHVAMESTGVYWKPIYNLLEAEDIETLVVNAAHIKAVPGRKTDVKDSEWIAELLQHGLLKGSYIPKRDQRELRELVRYRRSLVQERSREVNRLQKVLEGANIKLSNVVSNVLGVSGRKMVEELIKEKDEKDLEVIAQLARGRMQEKIPQIIKALNGTIGKHQKMIIAAQLEHVDFLTKKIEDIDKEVEERMIPFKESLTLLDGIPGVGLRVAQEIVAEIGTDMERFADSSKLSSWAGISPGNNESAGKRKTGKTTKGNKHLKSALTEAARAAAKIKNTYLSAQYKRIAARRGKNRAAIAVGHSILVIVYHILKYNKPFKELGDEYFIKQREKVVMKSAVKRLELLGFKVSLEPKAS